MVLDDRLAPGLLVVFVGSSVGERSAQVGHYFAGRGNTFWPLLDATGLTGHAGLTAERDSKLLDHRLGLTDVVKTRAASSNRRLRQDDYDVAGFLERIERCAPAIVAFHDTDAITRVARHIRARPVRPAIGDVGWTIAASRVYRLPSPSGTNTHMTYETKRAAWETFGRWARRVTAASAGGR